MTYRKKEILTNETFREQLRQLPYDPLVDDYKEQILNTNFPSDILIFPNQFFYITDLKAQVNKFIHPNTMTVLGYDQENFKEIGFIYEKTHAEDKDFVLAFSLKSIAHTSKVREILKVNPFSGVFYVDFRVHKADGQQARLNRQTSCFRVDKDGNMIYALSLFTDISHLNKPNCISCSWSGSGVEDFNIDDIIHLKKNCMFSERETEVLTLLAKGLDGREIAQKLSISEHTVISHRKNMLKKTSTKNTVELVHYAVSKGII
jgi:DNA-binding CsgD family transcriptional regulator